MVYESRKVGKKRGEKGRRHTFGLVVHLGCRCGNRVCVGSIGAYDDESDTHPTHTEKYNATPTYSEHVHTPRLAKNVEGQTKKFHFLTGLLLKKA